MQHERGKYELPPYRYTSSAILTFNPRNIFCIHVYNPKNTRNLGYSLITAISISQLDFGLGALHLRFSDCSYPGQNNSRDE